MNNNDEPITQEHIPAITAPSDLQTARKLFTEACKFHTQDPNEITWQAVTVSLAEVHRIERETRAAHWQLLIVVCDKQKAKQT